MWTKNIKHNSWQRQKTVVASVVDGRVCRSYKQNNPEISYKKKLIKESHGFYPVKSGTLHV